MPQDPLARAWRECVVVPESHQRQEPVLAVLRSQRSPHQHRHQPTAHGRADRDRAPHSRREASPRHRSPSRRGAQPAVDRCRRPLWRPEARRSRQAQAERSSAAERRSPIGPPQRELHRADGRGHESPQRRGRVRRRRSGSAPRATRSPFATNPAAHSQLRSTPRTLGRQPLHRGGRAQLR